MASGKKLAVWMNGLLVGHWSLSAGEDSFAYADEWLDSGQRRPISLSMPLRVGTVPYRGKVVANFFDNLLPDSSLVRTTLQTRLGLDTRDPMALLEHLGRDCLGALQLLPLEEPGLRPDSVDGIPLTDLEIAKILRELPRYPMGVAQDTEIRLSLAGNHEKTALLRHHGEWLRPIGPTPTTHILKLPIGITPEGLDLRRSVENEWLCLRFLSELGLLVAEADISDFEDQRCLVVKRFDRVESAGSITRLPHEDLCQATGTAPAFKYESDGGPGIKQCLHLLVGSTNPAEDREVFFQAQIAFWLLCGIDGHAKNFSLSILRLGRFKLAPLYDVLSAYPIMGHGTGKLAMQEATMAMAVWGKNRHYRWNSIHRRHWLRTAKDCGIPNGESLLIDLCSEATEAVQRVRDSLPTDFPEQIAQPILDGVLNAAQRLRS